MNLTNFNNILTARLLDAVQNLLCMACYGNRLVVADVVIYKRTLVVEVCICHLQLKSQDV